MSGETPAERAEAARTRRRWISLAETVAVLGVVIAGLSLWLTWSDRRADQRDRAAQSALAAREQGRFDLRGTVSADGEAIVLQRDDRHELRDVRVTFPAVLGIGSRDAVDLRIMRDWFEKPVLAATTDKGAYQVGRVPVLVAYTYSDGDVQQTRSGIYDIVWRSRGRFLRGRALTITGFRSRRSGGSQAAINALWTAGQ